MLACDNFPNDKTETRAVKTRQNIEGRWYNTGGRVVPARQATSGRWSCALEMSWPYRRHYAREALHSWSIAPGRRTCIRRAPPWLRSRDQTLVVLRGIPHREDGPARLSINPVTGIVTHEEYLIHGKLHREDGPAVIYRHPLDGHLRLTFFHVAGVQQEDAPYAEQEPKRFEFQALEY